MARKVKPKISYKKKNKVPKAFIGAAFQLGSGIVQTSRAKKAEKNFDQDRLNLGVSSATQKMVEQPIDQGLIESMQGQQAADRASAMGALSKDPRNALAGVQALEGQAGKQRTELLSMQQDAKTAAMGNLAKEQQAQESQRLKVATGEIEGIKAEKAAGQQNIMSGIEGIESSAMSLAGMPAKEGARIKAKKGAKIDAEEGGVTPDEFSHDTNPIDLVQDGEKIGEATGGELILPPDDVDDIRQALQNEDKDTAFDLMKGLVAKYDSNVIEGKDSEAQDGATIPTGAIPKDKAAKIMKYVMRKDYYGSPEAPDYVDVAKEELSLTDKETEFLTKYAESRKKSSKKREQAAYDKRSESGQMGGDLSMGGYLKRMVSKIKK